MKALPLLLAVFALGHSLPSFAADASDPYGVISKSQQDERAREQAEEAAAKRQLLASMEQEAVKKGGASVRKGSVVNVSCEGKGEHDGEYNTPAYTCIQVCLTNHKGCEVDEIDDLARRLISTCEPVPACE